MDAGRAVFLLTALATHGAIGYVLVAVFTATDAHLGAVLAIAPDVDFLFPAEWGPLFVHRGITHTPTFAVVVIACAYGFRRRRSDAATATLALGSHLAIDALSPMGLPLLIPVGSLPTPGLAIHGHTATVLIWCLAGLLLVVSGDSWNPGTPESEERL